MARLTGTDARALSAAAHAIDLFFVSADDQALSAFHDLVLCMQPSVRELAYHAIAHFGEWDDRQRLWARAGLQALPHVRACEGEL